MAKDAMEKIYARGQIPILVGGTGFYIQAVTRDIDFTRLSRKTDTVQELEANWQQEKGPAYLHQMLAEVDPVSRRTSTRTTSKRVIRALEFYHQNSTPDLRT